MNIEIPFNIQKEYLEAKNFSLNKNIAKYGEAIGLTGDQVFLCEMLALYLVFNKLR